MIQDTIRKIETRLEAADAVGEDTKSELLRLLSTLRSQVEDLSETDAEHAESLARFVDVTAHEATRNEKDPVLLDLSVEALSSSVKHFETSHPKLVQTVNGLCMLLSNLGI